MKIAGELERTIKKIEKSVLEKAQEYGTPIYYLINGKRIRQEPNGDRYERSIGADGMPIDNKL